MLIIAGRETLVAILPTTSDCEIRYGHQVCHTTFHAKKTINFHNRIKGQGRFMASDNAPFCSQPWSTLYVQWDGKVTRPCIRGPQNMGSLDTFQEIGDLWGGTALQAVRQSVATETHMNTACGTCHVSQSRTIDHINSFGRNIGGDFGFDKVANYYDVYDSWQAGTIAPNTGPVVIVMDMSAKCHLRCQKCFVYHSDMQYGLGHMPDAVFEKVRPLFRTALEVIGHENGECMLHKRFIEMVTEIKANGCRFMFNTTGQLIDEEKARQLVELGVDKIMLSIDAIESDTYAYLHKGGTLEKVFNGIAAINREKHIRGVTKPRLGWYFVACRSNIDQLVSAAKLAVEWGFGMMFVTHLNKPTGEQWRSYFDFYRKESLFADPELRLKYTDALAEVRALTTAAGLEFFSGSADA